jgi:uncharacterized membrane protein YkvI
MIKSISGAVESGHGTAVLYAGVIGLLLSDIIPTPADAIYFRLQEKNKTKLENKLITPKQYWTRDAVAYYGLNPLWWSLVLGAVLFTKGDVGQKAKVGLAIIGGGAVLGVLSKNIKEEEKRIQINKK